MWYLLLLLLRCVVCQSILPISVKGTKLYDSDGSQFFIKGVAYVPGSATIIDPLARPSQCQVDAGMMKTLGINTIRVYTVDPTLNHDACMQSFASQGIYVAVDLPIPTLSISRVDPAWTLPLFNHYTSTIDAFSKYNNTLTYFVGNEIVNDAPTTTSSPVIRAAVRDMKAYRDARGYRKIPMAYSSSDLDLIRQPLSEYLTCNDQASSIEMYAMNTYSWCGNSSYYTAHYDTMYEQFQALNVPVFFSETGCNSVSRDFSDVSTMLGPIFQAVFSGAIVYEWANENSNYGIVSYNSSDFTGFPKTLSDFGHLSTVLATANPTGTSKSAYTPSNSIPACPTTDQNWSVKSNAVIPTIAGLDIRTISAVTTYTTSFATTTTETSTKATGLSGQAASGTSSSENSNHGLSTGAKAGVAVGAIAILLAGLASIYFFFVRRHRSTSKETTGLLPNSDHDSEAEKPELPAKSIKRHVPKPELEASSPQFWQAYYSRNGSTAELEGQNHPGNPNAHTYEMFGRPLGTVHEIG